MLKPEATPYLTAPEVATRLRCSLRTVHELSRRNAIPLRQLPGSRRLLFPEHDLQRWECGAALEVVDFAGGGRIVRLVAAGTDEPRSNGQGPQRVDKHNARGE